MAQRVIDKQMMVAQENCRAVRRDDCRDKSDSDKASGFDSP